MDTRTCIRYVSFTPTLCLVGSCSFVSILILRAGCNSWAEWIGKFPCHASQLRRAVLTADGWMYRRFWDVYQRWPWKLAIICDVRATLESRLKVANELLTEDCMDCLDEFFCRRLRSMYDWWATAGDMCRDRFFLSAILAWAWSVLIHIAQVEGRHAQNRRTHDTRSTLRQLVSNFVNREAQTVRKALAQMRDLIDRPGIGNALPLVVSSTSDSAFIQRMSSIGRSLDQWEVLRARESAHGRNNFRNTYESTVAYKSQLLALPDDEYRRIVNIATMTKHTAKRASSAKKASTVQLARTTVPPPESSEPRRHCHAALNSHNEWIANPPDNLEFPTFGDASSSKPLTAPIVGPAILSAVIKNTKGGAEAVRSNYTHLVTHIGSGLLKPEQQMPTKVKYPKMCTALCNTRYPQSVHNLLCRFVDALDKFRNTVIGQPYRTPLYDLLIACVVHTSCPESLPIVRFALLPISSARSGTESQTFTFTQLEPRSCVAALGPYAGTILDVVYEPHVLPKCGAPSNLLAPTQGVMTQLCESKFIAYLVDATCASVDTVRKISVYRLTHSYAPDVHRLDVFVVGTEAAIGICDIDLDVPPPGRPRPAAPPKRSDEKSFFDSSSSSSSSDADEPALAPPPLPDASPLPDDPMYGILGGAEDEFRDVLLDDEREPCSGSDVSEDDAVDDRDDDDAAVVDPLAEPHVVVPFPPPPHDLVSIVDWGRSFSVRELETGLAYMGARIDGIKVFAGSVHIGTIRCRWGKLLIAECCHKAVDMPPARRAGAKASAKASASAIQLKRTKCRISIGIPSENVADRLVAERTLFLWLIAGTCCNSCDHINMARRLQAESRGNQ